MRLLTRLLLLLIIIVPVLLGPGPARLSTASSIDLAENGNGWQNAGQYAPPPNITAEFGVVIEGDTGKVLFAKDMNVRAAPASLTKIVTAMLAIEKGRLTDKVKVDVDSWKMEVETNSSVMGLMPGEELTLEALLYGLLLPSGNDAALAIARYIGGSEQQFAQMMNAKVLQLGLTNTHFVNPHGLDAADHYSTAYDMAVLGRYAMANPVFAKIVGTEEKTFVGLQRTYNLVCVNTLLWNYPGADGVKIGFTARAKQTIVGSAVRNGRRLYVGLLRSSSRLADSSALLDYYFANPAATVAGSPTATTTAIIRATQVVTRSATAGPSPTLARTSTPGPAPTRAWTTTPVPTRTPLPTSTWTATATSTSTSTATSTATATPTPTATDTPTPTITPEPIEEDRGSTGTSWSDVILSLPWRALQSAISLIWGIFWH
ncbi:MAG: D-alanyl-D-alanine carboxypeptidase family protein [Dehalococcoidia bacterium]|nr:D-alanyl-D-alanine carboxypeptidase family protein [Dehalococcoidia bacterium]